MDEYLLNDLLECSVCLDRLDTSSKVLPCQHTFCKKCLEEIVSTKKELRCPECRILVTTSIDELPPNVLLMRILEGMRHAGNLLPKRKVTVVLKQSPTAHVPNSVPNCQTLLNTIETLSTKPDTASKQNIGTNQVMARALYDYQSSEPGNLCFKKGELIALRSKVDTYWAQGECSGRVGMFPLTFVQILTSLPPQVATCRALYDFRMNNEEVEGCLSFRKDEVLSVLRRVDENWVEGRLGARIGIFPLAFVELNPVAKALMKLSSNEQPGPSRLAPPTPSEESTPLISTDITAGTGPELSRVTGRASLSPPPAESNRLTSATSFATSNRFQPAPPEARLAVSSTVGSLVCGRSVMSESNSSTSTTTPNSSGTSSNSSSNSSTAPSSPASPQQQAASQPLNPFIRPQTILLPTSHITTQQARDKRHSFNGVAPNEALPPPANRHSAEILSSGELTAPAENSCSGQMASAQTPREGSTGREQQASSSQRHRRSGSDFALVHLPAAYVALYPYKPHKPDELELKKGGVYLVTERCQDGWFKGTSNRTQKCGVFPGNYVTLAKPLQNSHSRVVSSSPGPMVAKARSPGTRQTAQCSLAPPELPPRATSPAPRLHRHQWTFPVPPPSEPETMAVELPVGPAPAVPSKSPHSPHLNTVSPTPTVPVSVSPVSPKSTDKVKEKKEKSGIMKRLAAMKRSKSPTVPAYSMDNPVFEDSPATSQPALHSAHSRSGSCPSQLMQMPAGVQAQRSISTSLSARGTRQKEGPSMVATTAHFPLARSRATENGSPAPQALTPSHRKSSSLDAGDPRNPKHLVPSVRERYRCIVPYPPNSEYELELRVGDIIYVHRKREDGWYKGTQQRTGRTGLFPASFVEIY